jgi:tetratricopeptide (TPR) repeat protein
VKQAPDNEEYRKEMADAHFRLGHIYRVLEDPEQAVREYRQAIAQFEELRAKAPGQPAYRQALANSYNWLGETKRTASDGYADAEKAYASALALQNELVAQHPDETSYRQELARTHYNRGILFASGPSDDATLGRANADFREAIRLLEPLAGASSDAELSQELARAYNNLANIVVIGSDADARAEATALYDKAIARHEALLAKEPRNREYMLELAKFSDNLADVLREAGHTDLALLHNTRAIDLIQNLMRARPSLAVEEADAHNLRGRILQMKGSSDAVGEYRQALEGLEDVANTADRTQRGDLHLRFGDLLLNLGALSTERPGDQQARQVLADAVGFYTALGEKAASTGDRSEAREILDNVTRLVPALSDRDQRAFGSAFEQLRRAVGEQK